MPFSLALHFVMRQGLSRKQEPTDSTRWTAQEHQRKAFAFPFEFWDFKHMLPCLVFYGGAMNLNTDAHGWQASSLLSKIPPKSQILIFSWKPIFCGIKLSQYCISFFSDLCDSYNCIFFETFDDSLSFPLDKKSYMLWVLYTYHYSKLKTLLSTSSKTLLILPWLFMWFNLIFRKPYYI